MVATPETRNENIPPQSTTEGANDFSNCDKQKDQNQNQNGLSSSLPIDEHQSEPLIIADKSLLVLPDIKEVDNESSLGSTIDADDEYDDFQDGDDDDYDIADSDSLVRDDPIFEQIKQSVSKTLHRADSLTSVFTTTSVGSEVSKLKTAETYTSIPYGFQPKAAYEHGKKSADIMGVAYNGRMRQFVILDAKGVTTWKRDLVANRIQRALMYPKYEYRLVTYLIYASKYNCYFGLGKDFSLKVLNKDFDETCSVNADLRSVLFMLFNPVRDELITGGVGGTKIWRFHQAVGRVFQELKPLANYQLSLKYQLPNVGGSWVKRVELDQVLQHLYCCSDTDLYAYDLKGKLLFKFERAHTMSITGCVYSMFAKVLITSSVDSEVKVWSLNGGLVHGFRGHSRAVTSLLLHPETSSIIITSSLDGSVRMWSLVTMDLLYTIVVSADGVLWMGLTDDKLLFISTCRNISLWNVNHFFHFWAFARNNLERMYLTGCEGKTTRLLTLGDDSSVRLFARSNQKNLTTVLPPPNISPLHSVLSVCYTREFNVVFLLVNPKEVWIYTSRTDPSCRIAVWNIHAIQAQYLATKSKPEAAQSGGWSVSLYGQGGASYRATENGMGNEVVSDCCCVCVLNSSAMMMTDEGFCCPIKHTYLLLGLEDGRILFMDPVMKGQKYMEFKASKDSIQDIKHDAVHMSLMTMVKPKDLALIQIWSLPTLQLQYEVYCAVDVTDYTRLDLHLLTGHETGCIYFHFLELVADTGMTRAKVTPEYSEVVDDKKRPEHSERIVAVDSSASMNIFCSCSSDGAIKIWNDHQTLTTEIMLEESLSAACFLNEAADLVVAFKNHIFYIDHSKVCPHMKAPEIEKETFDQESEIYEDPAVRYEGLVSEDQLTLDKYLVPFDIEFSNDFLEGKMKIDDMMDETEEESGTESSLSFAPTDLYYSPPSTPGSLSLIDLTLGSEITKYDLVKQMDTTLLSLRKGRHRKDEVSVVLSEAETPALSDKEDDNLNLPAFGDSPGPTPPPTPPPDAAVSPTDGKPPKEEIVVSEEEQEKEKPKVFVPVELPPAEEAKPAKKIAHPKAMRPSRDGSIVEEKRKKYGGIKAVKVDVHSLLKTDKKNKLLDKKEADHSHIKPEDPKLTGEDGLLDEQQKKDIKKKQLIGDRKLPKRLQKPFRMEQELLRRQMEHQKRIDWSQMKKPYIPGEHHIPHQQEHHDHHQHPPEADTDIIDTEMPNLKLAEKQTLDELQDELWSSELLGTKLQLPDKKGGAGPHGSKTVRISNQQAKVHMFESYNEPGVGSSPTDELEKMDDDKLDTVQDTRGLNDAGHGYLADGEKDSATDQGRLTPETLVQRSRIGKRFPIEDRFGRNAASTLPRTTPDTEMRKLKIVLPSAELSVPDTHSSCRDSPDSVMYDSDAATFGSGMQMVSGSYADGTDESSGDATLLSKPELAYAKQRPASSYTGTTQGLLDREKMRQERPHTAHVKFMAELELILELPDNLQDLQLAFDSALKKYQSFPVASEASADTLYRNDGLVFEDDWQDRVIERHMLLRMQKELRMRSAAVRRKQLSDDRFKLVDVKERSKSSIGHCRSDSSIQVLQQVKKANRMSIGRHTSGRPLVRPKTAHAVMVRSERCAEKPYRYRLSQEKPEVPPMPSSRPSSASSTMSNSVPKRIFDPRKIDPRNPSAVKPVVSKSIPSRCSRYVLITKPRETSKYPMPSPLESQLLAQRFPKLGSVVYKHNVDTLTRSRAVSPTMDYSPYLYQWSAS